MANTPDLVSTSEAAAILGVHGSTLTRWVQLGRLNIAKRLNDSPQSPMLFDRKEVTRLAAKLAEDAA